MSLLCNHEWKEGVVIMPYTLSNGYHPRTLIIEFWRMGTHLVPCAKCIKCGESHVDKNRAL